MFRVCFKHRVVCCAVLALLSGQAHAEEESALEQLVVRGKKTNDILPTFPSTAVSIDAEIIADTVNAVDTPDALKYFPGIFVRKRDSADYNGAPVGSRIWGNNYSAKHIVTVDGVPITNQIFQNNSYGSPKWWVTSPDDIQTIEVMYGPFSAAYSGNATGAVVNIATQMPETFEASVNTTLATQHFQKFGTSDTNNTGALNLMLGNKAEGLSWRLSLNHEDAMTQPRLWVTSDKLNVTGYEYHSKNYSTNGSYVGAGSIIHGVSDSLNLKLSYDITPELKLGLLTGVWQGNSDAPVVQSYLNGYPSGGAYGTIKWQDATTANAFFLDQLHVMNAITLKTRADQVFSWELAASNFRYQNDKQRWGQTLLADGSLSTTQPGSLADYSGTGWTNLDFRGNYRWSTANTLSFGVHQDHNNYQYLLTTDKAGTSNWLTAEQLATDNTIACGETQTQALWIQDMWKVHDRATMTAGLRSEYWKAYGGYNYASSTKFPQPEKNANGFSPKLSLMLDGPNDWLTTASVAQTVRFASLTELYSVAKCSDTISPANACKTNGTLDTSYISTGNYADLKPEKVTSAELSFEKIESAHNFRATLFGEVTRDAILAQYGVLNPAHPQGLYSYSLNVEKVHAYGLELAGLWRNVGFDGLDLNGQVTRVWSAIDDSSSKGSLGQNIVGNPLTYVSPWRAMAMATYRPDEKWTYNISGRYQKAGASSLDNNDYVRSTYGGFDSFFVVDTKVRYKFDKQWTASVGIDNLLNRDYWIYHPFPQRTFVANLKYVH